MARTVACLPTGSRITDYISLGVIAKFFPREEVHAVLEQTGRVSVRERDLPAHVVVYYVIALALYMRLLIARSCAVYWRVCSGCWTHRQQSKLPASRVFHRRAPVWVPNLCVRSMNPGWGRSPGRKPKAPGIGSGVW